MHCKHQRSKHVKSPARLYSLDYTGLPSSPSPVPAATTQNTGVLFCFLILSPVSKAPPQPFHSGAPSSCTSGGCLASGHRVFQSLLSSIQHQVPSPSTSQCTFPTLFLFLSWKRSPRTPALRAVEKKVEASSASAHNAQPRYPR